LPSYRRDPTVRETGRLPARAIEEYLKSGRFFIAPAANDPLLLQEIASVGEDHILFSSDFPRAEGRDNAASEILERSDLDAARNGRFFTTTP
jgi:predicted TIM-barrel fold metal-dependent hydrolase